VKRCHTCKQTGHLSYNCPKAPKPSESSTRQIPTNKKTGTERKYKCFSCGEWGHIAMNCPSNALFCDDEHTEDVFGAEAGEGAIRRGMVEGMPVEILLDTGSENTCTARVGTERQGVVWKISGGQVCTRRQCPLSSRRSGHRSRGEQFEQECRSVGRIVSAVVVGARCARIT
jgi:hypothetical protein